MGLHCDLRLAPIPEPGQDHRSGRPACRSEVVDYRIRDEAPEGTDRYSGCGVQNPHAGGSLQGPEDGRYRIRPSQHHRGLSDGSAGSSEQLPLSGHAPERRGAHIPCGTRPVRQYRGARGQRGSSPGSGTKEIMLRLAIKKNKLHNMPRTVSSLGK